MRIMVSESGEIHGMGSQPYRWVSKLTKSERDHVRAGGIVLIRDTNTHYMATDFKRVTLYNGKFSYRNYYPE